jgi:activator of HSP90 ATPase
MANTLGLSRRGFSLAATATFSALGAAAAPAEDLGISSANKAIHQEVTFRASALQVYHALTDPRRFDKVVLASGALQAMGLPITPCEISGELGGAFSLFGGYITGRHVEMSPGVRLVQAWRADSWAPHIYSIVRFELSERPEGARLSFDHTGFPDDEAVSLATGWRKHYWEPLAKVLA